MLDFKSTKVYNQTWRTFKMVNHRMSSKHINQILGNLTIGAQGGAISGANGSSANWNNNVNIFSFDPEQEKIPQELVRKYEIFESVEDLLALSCAWHRLRTTARDPIPHIGFTITKLLDKNLFNAVNEEDRLFASSIRDYYSKKIMMLKLKNERMSQYREDLNTFIHSDGKKFVEKMFGLAYRLPQFYLYDTKLDEIFRGRNRKTNKKIPNIDIKTLTYVGSTMVDRKSLKRNEYWFVDEEDTLVTVYLAHNNPLLGVWEKLIRNPITLEGSYYNKSRDDHEYYQVEKYKLVM